MMTKVKINPSDLDEKTHVDNYDFVIENMKGEEQDVKTFAAFTQSTTFHGINYIFQPSASLWRRWVSFRAIIDN